MGEQQPAAPLLRWQGAAVPRSFVVKRGTLGNLMGELEKDLRKVADACAKSQCGWACFAVVIAILSKGSNEITASCCGLNL